mgnify:FL=1
MRVGIFAIAVMVAVGTGWLMRIPIAVADSSIPGQAVFEQFGAAATAAGTGQQEAGLEVVVMKIIRATLGLVGIVLVGLLIYAGWLYMTAHGESDQVEKAKGIIKHSIIGMIIVLSSYVISIYVVNALLKSTATTPWR